MFDAVDLDQNIARDDDAANNTTTVWDTSNSRAPKVIQNYQLQDNGNPWDLAFDPTGRYLFVVAPRARQVNVTPGPVIGDMIQVSGLLDAGDRLVVRGAERLSAGNSVKIIDLTGRTSRDRSDTARLQ